MVEVHCYVSIEQMNGERQRGWHQYGMFVCFMGYHGNGYHANLDQPGKPVKWTDLRSLRFGVA